MISVIIPTYKGSDKILLPLYSVVKQSYKELEIIVVDDNGRGSIEQIKTECILKPLIEQKIIRYIVHEKNKNGSAARNTGIRYSKGEYINFLDDDDFMFSDKLEKQKAILENSSKDVGAVVCGSYFVHEDGKGVSSIPNCEVKNLKRDYLCEKIKFNTSAILFKREVILEFLGFDETFKRHQDWEFCFRIMSKYSFINCNEILLIKYATGRNCAENPEVGIGYYKHFNNRLSTFLSRLDENDQAKINSYHDRRLYKSYIISRRSKDAVRYARDNKMSIFQQFKSIIELSWHVVKRFTISNKKVAKSYEEYMNEAKSYWNMKV